MQCNCGGEVATNYHQVKTVRGAKGWLIGNPDYLKPLDIRQDRCNGCGRSRVTVRDATGEIIEKRG